MKFITFACLALAAVAAVCGAEASAKAATVTAVHNDDNNGAPPLKPIVKAGNAKTVSGGGWVQNRLVTRFCLTTPCPQPPQIAALGSFRMSSPACPAGKEATACGYFSPRTPVVGLTLSPSIGTATASTKTSSCTCDFRNTINTAQTSEQMSGIACSAYCQ